MKLPRQGSVNESRNLARCTRIECVKLINFILCMRQVGGWLPGILTFPIARPVDEEFESTIKDFTVPNVVDFVLFLAFHCDRVRWGWQEPINLIPFVSREAIDVEDIMYFEGGWQVQLVVNMRDDLLNPKRAKLFRSEFHRLLIDTQLFGLQPQFIAHFKCRFDVNSLYVLHAQFTKAQCSLCINSQGAKLLKTFV